MQAAAVSEHAGGERQTAVRRGRSSAESGVVMQIEQLYELFSCTNCLDIRNPVRVMLWSCCGREKRLEDE